MCWCGSQGPESPASVLHVIVIFKGPQLFHVVVYLVLLYFWKVLVKMRCHLEDNRNI